MAELEIGDRVELGRAADVPDLSGGAWYLAHVPHGAEALSAHAVAARGCLVYLPVRRRIRQDRRKPAMRAEALGVAFPGYVFVQSAQPEMLRRAAMILPGDEDPDTGQDSARLRPAILRWMVAADGTPRVIDRRVIGALQRREEAGEFDLVGRRSTKRGGMRTVLCQGQRVRLPSNLEALIREIDGDVARVEVTCFGKVASSEMPLSALRPLESAEAVIAQGSTALASYPVQWRKSNL